MRVLGLLKQGAQVLTLGFARNMPEYEGLGVKVYEIRSNVVFLRPRLKEHDWCFLILLQIYNNRLSSRG